MSKRFSKSLAPNNYNFSEKFEKLENQTKNFNDLLKILNKKSSH